MAGTGVIKGSKQCSFSSQITWSYYFFNIFTFGVFCKETHIFYLGTYQERIQTIKKIEKPIRPCVIQLIQPLKLHLFDVSQTSLI